MKKNPCKECPFRRDSLAGWLGDLEPEPKTFLDALDHIIVPCHMNVKHDEKEGRNMIVDGEYNPCIGALQFCANSIKYPRAARERGTTYNRLIDAAKPNPDVFQWGQEFIDHHSNHKLKL